MTKLQLLQPKILKDCKIRNYEGSQCHESSNLHTFNPTDSTCWLREKLNDNLKNSNYHCWWSNDCLQQTYGFKIKNSNGKTHTIGK